MCLALGAYCLRNVGRGGPHQQRVRATLRDIFSKSIFAPKFVTAKQLAEREEQTARRKTDYGLTRAALEGRSEVAPDTFEERQRTSCQQQAVAELGLFGCYRCRTADGWAPGRRPRPHNGRRPRPASRPGRIGAWGCADGGILGRQGGHRDGYGGRLAGVSAYC